MGRIKVSSLAFGMPVWTAPLADELEDDALWSYGILTGDPLIAKDVVKRL